MTQCTRSSGNSRPSWSSLTTRSDRYLCASVFRHRPNPSAILLTTPGSSGLRATLTHPKRLECLQATHLDQQWYRGVAQRSESPSWWPMQITVLPLNWTSSSRSPLNFNNNQGCFRQEVEEHKEREVQATPTETNGRLGAVQDRQQECTTITPLLFPPELTCL